MKSLVTVLLSFGLVCVAAPLGAQSRGGGVAYVSVQKIFSEAAEAKAATKRIEDLRRMRTEEVQAKQKALEATQLEVANAGGFFSAGRRAELQAKEKQQREELQQTTQKAQAELHKLQSDLQTGLRTHLASVIQEIAKTRGIQLVLNTDTAVVWAATGADLTAEVLKKLDEKATNAKEPAKP